MSLGEGEILDVGSGRFTHPKPVEPEEYRKSCMALVEALGREEKGSELPTIQAPTLGGVGLGAPDVLGRIGGDPSVDVSKSSTGRDPSVPSRCGRARYGVASPP